jgi:hypothetical protein
VWPKNGKGNKCFLKRAGKKEEQKNITDIRIQLAKLIVW